MKRIGIIIGMTALMLVSAVAVAQQPPPAKAAGVVATPKDKNTLYVPGHLLTLLSLEKEKTLQLQANAMTKDYQTQMKAFQDQYAGYEKDFTDWVAQVKKDNNWDDSYTYDRDSDTWTHVVKPAPEKPEVKAAVPEKK